MTPKTGRNLTEHERHYNVAHRSVRNVIERQNGVLKLRFKCLVNLEREHYTFLQKEPQK